MEKGSQHREHSAPAIGSLELCCQRHDLLVQRIAKCSHQAYARLGRLSMIDLQSTALGGDGCPDILARQSLAHTPRLVQQRDLTLGCDQTQKMYSPCSERQHAWQLLDLLHGQLPSPDLLRRLTGCRPLQRWWMVALRIETHELRRCTSHRCQSIEAMRAPECLAPQPMQSLDHTVALGFADGQEDRFDPDVQTQAHKGAKQP